MTDNSSHSNQKKGLAQRIYLSPFGFIISITTGLLAIFHRPFMVYGYFKWDEKKYYKRTRISSSAKLMSKSKITLNNNAWIGHYCLLDGIGGITIGEGVNIASHTCIYTHSSQNSIRLLGKKFIEIPAINRIGYIIEGVAIGDYTFIGAACVILPGTTIGKGCIVGAGSVVKGAFADYSVIAGNPAKIINDTRTIDKKLFSEGISSENYYDRTLIEAMRSTTTAI